MDIVSYLKEAPGEYFSDVLQDARKENLEYDEAIKELVKQSRKIMRFEDDPDIQTYRTCHNALIGMEQSILYYQGYRDCISF